MMVVLYFSCNFGVIVQRGGLCLPTPPSWLEVWLCILKTYLEIIPKPWVLPCSVIYAKYINLKSIINYHPHFTDEETVTKRLTNLPKILQLANSKARVFGSRVHILNHLLLSFLVKVTDSYNFFVNLIIILCSSSRFFVSFFSASCKN